MGNTNPLPFWNAIALVIRLLTIGLLLRVIQVQVKQFQVKSFLQPLKRWLLAMVILIGLSTAPILWIHIDRVAGIVPTTRFASVATVANAVSVFLIALILLKIYSFQVPKE